MSKRWILRYVAASGAVAVEHQRGVVGPLGVRPDLVERARDHPHPEAPGGVGEKRAELPIDRLGRGLAAAGPR